MTSLHGVEKTCYLKNGYYYNLGTVTFSENICKKLNSLGTDESETLLSHWCYY